ncbi:MAG TPA: hypothetical protein EYP92_08750 [Candidatus Thioglobus sp.]|jgi:hypothetical protein|nr:hypothetical protein [Candidatus Thioglobus sp.]HIL42778.1 hypothetical protein [Gammaproteobacteria bacterium]
MSYTEQFKGRFIGIMQWEDCDSLLHALTDNPNQWYVYNTSSDVPISTVDADEFIQQINEIKGIITKEHQERYCGIVYTDDIDNPSFVKIFHPKHLGKACGSSEKPPLPRWLLSKTQPTDVVEELGYANVESGFFTKYLKF